MSGLPAIAFFVPYRTKNPNNAGLAQTPKARFAVTGQKRREHKMGMKAARAAMIEQRVSPASLIPAIVTLKRYSTGRLDPHDGLRGAFKWVVDGIAEALGVDDGGPFVEWRYEQGSLGKGKHGFGVTIERRRP